MNRVVAALFAAMCLSAACSSSEPTTETFCDQIATMGEFDDALADVDLSDSDAVTGALESFRDEFETLSKSSPSEIQTEAETVARFGSAIADAALSADPDDRFDSAAALAAATASEPDAAAALETLASYASRHCTTPPTS